MKQGTSIALLAWSALIAAPAAVTAEEVPGVKLGGFILYPDVKLRTEYDSNVYRGSGRGPDAVPILDDLVVHVIPTASLKSNWKQHALNIAVQGDAAFHQDLDTEDYTDLRLLLDGAVDVSPRVRLTARASQEYLHTDRADPDDTRSLDPEEFTLSTLGVGAVFKTGSWRASLAGDFSQRDFDDVSIRLPGGELGLRDSDYKDREQAELKGELGFNLDEKTEFFGRLVLNERNYDNPDRLGGFGTVDGQGAPVRRDSAGYVAGAGVRYTSERLTGEGFAGWMEQDYDWDGVDTIGEYALAGSINYRASARTSLGFSFTRDNIAETNTRYAAIVSSRLKAEVEHRLTRKLTLFGELRLTDWEFVEPFDNAPNRNEDTLGIRLRGRYRFSPRIYAEAGLGFDEKYADTEINDFVDRRAFLGLGVNM